MPSIFYNCYVAPPQNCIISSFIINSMHPLTDYIPTIYYLDQISSETNQKKPTPQPNPRHRD